MHRLSLTSISAPARSAPRHRLSLGLAPLHHQGRRNLSTSGAALRASTSSSSSPKKAEGPSAQSGGSRSKDAVEAAAAAAAAAAEEQTKSAAEGEAQQTTTGAMPDDLVGSDKRGVTGGGRPLASSASPPPQPKIHNASVSGHRKSLTAEQQREVDRHNEEFEAKHGRAASAGDDKVDKKFWSGAGRKG